MSNKCEGVLYKDKEGFYILRLESDKKSVIEKYKPSKPINGINGVEKFFLVDFQFACHGEMLNKGKIKYFVQFKVFNYAIGENCFSLDEFKVKSAICEYDFLDMWYKGKNDTGIPNHIHLENGKKLCKDCYQPYSRFEV